MAGETRPSGRSRPASGTSSDTPDLTAQETDPTLAPITANTPLPPVTPLPLASQSGGGNSAPQPPPEFGAAPGDQPPFAEAASQRATDPSITAGWAARTTFVLMLVSAVLLAAMAIAYTAATKQTGLLIWVVIIIIAVNIAYPLIVFSIARPGSAQPMRLPFMSPRRGP